MSDSHRIVSHEYLQTIFDQSADGLLLCSGEGRILVANKAAEKFNATSASELIGKNVRTLVEEGRIDRSATQEVIDSRRQVSVIQKSPNTEHTLLVTGTPIFDDNKNVAYVVVNERDISLIESMRQELEQARQESDRHRHRQRGRRIVGPRPVEVGVVSRLDRGGGAVADHGRADQRSAIGADREEPTALGAQSHLWQFAT